MSRGWTKGGPKRYSIVSVLCTDAEKAEIQRLAAQADMDCAAYVRSVIFGGSVGHNVCDELAALRVEAVELRHLREGSRRVLARWGTVASMLIEVQTHLRLKLRDGTDDLDGLRLARRIDEMLVSIGGQP